MAGANGARSRAHNGYANGEGSRDDHVATANADANSRARHVAAGDADDTNSRARHGCANGTS